MVITTIMYVMFLVCIMFELDIFPTSLENWIKMPALKILIDKLDTNHSSKQVASGYLSKVNVHRIAWIKPLTNDNWLQGFRWNKLPCSKHWTSPNKNPFLLGSLFLQWYIQTWCKVYIQYIYMYYKHIFYII